MPVKLPDVRQKVKITDGYKKPLAEIRREVDKTKTNFQRLRSAIKKASSGAHLKKLKAQIAQVKTAAMGIGAGFRQSARRAAYFAGIATAAIGGLVAKSAAYGDNVAKTAKKLNLSAEALQELRHAADLSGIAQEKFDGGMLKFQKRLGETVAGIGYAKDIYKDLGIQVEDTNGVIRPTEELFGEVADKLIGMEDKTKRTRYAMELFGRSGADMVLMMQDGSAGIEKMREEARKLGGVMSSEAAATSEQFVDTMARTKQVIGGVVRELGVALMPAIMDLAKRLQAFIKENRPAIRSFFKSLAEGIPMAINKLIKFVQNMRKKLAPVFDWLGRVINSIGWENSSMIAMGAFIGGPFIASLSNVIPLIKGIVGAVKVAIPMIKAFGAAIFGAGGPIGWIILGVMALIAVIIYFRKELKPIWIMYKQGLQPLFKDWRLLVDELKNAWNELAQDLGFGIPMWNELIQIWIQSVGWFAKLYAMIVSLPLRGLINQVRSAVAVFMFLRDILKGVAGVIRKNFKTELEWLGKKWDWLADKIEWVIGKLKKALGFAKEIAKKAGKTLGIAEEGQTIQYEDKDLGVGSGNRRLGLSGRQLTDQISQIGDPTYKAPTLAEKVKQAGGSSNMSTADLLRATGGGTVKQENKIQIDFKNMPQGVSVEGSGDASIDMNTGHAFGEG